MKKILQPVFAASLAILLTLGFSIQSQAQLTEGDIAPNFTYSDINGNSHTLYDYLDEGYSVMITMSATWCGPCWSFHSSGTKSALWAAHGPAGEPGVNDDTTDDMVLIFIEGDPQTTEANLNGSGTATQGDWVTGVNYPIIDLPTSALVNQYGLTGFPNAWLICPDRKISAYYNGYNSSTMNATAIYDAADGCAAAQGEVNPALAAYNGDTSVGCEGGAAEVIVTLQNMGNTTLESASIEVSSEGTLLLSYDWTGSLATYETAEVTVGTLDINEPTTISIDITSENEFTDNSTLEQTITDASEIGLDIEVRFYTDNYPSESSWEIRNNTGQIVASGGPYQPGTQDQWGGGGPDANTTKVHNVTLPAPDAEECYTIRVLDSFNDGLQYGTNPAGQFGLEVFYAGSSVVNLDLGDFGSAHVAPEVMKMTSLSTTEETSLLGLNLFPNPTSGMFNIEFDLTDAQNTQIDIFDVAGKRVLSKALGNMGAGYHMSTIDMSAMQPGVYVVNFTTDQGTEARKLMLTK